MITRLNTASVKVLDQDEALVARGVSDVTQEPIEHADGTDMGVCDPFGKGIRILQPAKAAQKARA